MSILKTMASKGPRRSRTPENDFHIRHRAYVIQPFMFHPVRPGETLKSMLWQARVVSDPLANPLMGWHLEYYVFYCQLQDAVPVGQEDTWLKALWDPTADFVSSWGSQTSQLEMGSTAAADTPDFKYKLYQRIIEEYFREEGEEWNSAHKMSGALALARRNRQDVFSDRASDFGSVDVTINVADGLTVTELSKAIQDYAMLVDTSMGAITTFEDYLASQNQGRFSDVKRAYRPELLRVIKEWTYPTNTVDPLSGTPTSAVSWSIQSRADKDRYFKEPGYLVGLTLARPKTLRPRVNDFTANPFKHGEDWLPLQAMHNPAAGADARALFEHGSQFVNWDAAGSAYLANNIQWVPVGGGAAGDSGTYPVETSINAKVWKSASSNNVRQDGRVALSILTDLPANMNIGAGDVDAAPVEADTEVHPFETLEDLATEYVAKLKEVKAGNRKVKLPNIRAAVQSMLENR